MPLIPLAPPIINGNYFDWSSVTIIFNTGRRIAGFKSIDYSSEQQPGKVFGTARQKLGRTPGQLEGSGSFEIYRPEFLDLQTELQGVQAINNLSVAPGLVQGLHEVSFNIIVSYSEGSPKGATFSLTSMATQTDTLVGARLSKIGSGGSQGSDAITVKCDFDLMYVAWNNAIPINLLLQAANI